MKTIHRFNFPTKTGQATQEMPMEFDLHASIGDWVEFEWMSGYTWEITRKKFKVLSDNTIEYIDYVTGLVEDPELP
jgi:hypothetical protein